MDTTSLRFSEKSAQKWNADGKSLKALEKYQEAIICYNRAIELQPQYAKAWFNKGNALRDFGKPKEALVCYDRVIAIEGGKNAVSWYAKGDVLESFRKYSEAIVCYDQAIAINPKYADAWNSKGAALFFSSEYDNALTCFKKAIEIEPKYIPAWNNKGRTLHELGRYEEAIACCDRILEIDPKHIDSWHNKKIALHALGKMASIMPQNYLKKLRQIALEELELKSVEKSLHFSSAELVDQASKEVQEGSYVSLYTEFGWECMKDGKYDKAAAAFRNSIQIDKDYSAYLDLSLAYRRMRKMKQALQYCEKAAEFIMQRTCRFIVEENEFAYLFGKAQECLSGLLDAVYEALLHDPDYACLCCYEGYVLLALRRDIEARQMFLEAQRCADFRDFFPEDEENEE